MTNKITSETDLIQNYLAPLAVGAPGSFGLKDDAALLTVPAGSDLVITADPIIAGVHFFETDRADDIAWKALAVNMSDLAAKGATPFAYCMTLAFPRPPDRVWMADFADGLNAAQADFGCNLIGGDTDQTPGPLSIGITAIGIVPRGGFVRRQGAQPGDHVFVTGTLGDSALGLAIHAKTKLFETVLGEGDRSFLVGRYLRPNPRLALAPALREHASGALDISDGFLKDLARLAGPNGMRVDFSLLPLSPSARSALAVDNRVMDAVLSGGDDYEILAAVAPDDVAEFAKAALLTGISVTDIGCLTADATLSVVDRRGDPLPIRRFGYDHFSV